MVVFLAEKHHLSNHPTQLQLDSKIFCKTYIKPTVCILYTLSFDNHNGLISRCTFVAFALAFTPIISTAILSQAATSAITSVAGFHWLTTAIVVDLLLLTALTKLTAWTLAFSSLAYAMMILVYVAIPSFREARKSMGKSILHMEDVPPSLAAESRSLFFTPIIEAAGCVALTLLSAPDMLVSTYPLRTAKTHVPIQNITEFSMQAKPTSGNMVAFDVEGWVMVKAQKKIRINL